MHSHIANQAEKALRASADFYLPVKILWLSLKSRMLIGDVTLSDFARILEKDERFKLFEGPRFEEEGLTIEEQKLKEKELERMGIVAGPRVGLAARRPTVEDLKRTLDRKIAYTMDALWRVWSARPPGDEKEEREIKDLMASIQAIQSEIGKALKEEGAEGEGAVKEASAKEAEEEAAEKEDGEREPGEDGDEKKGR
jgi:hypothetical protein